MAMVGDASVHTLGFFGNIGPNPGLVGAMASADGKVVSIRQDWDSLRSEACITFLPDAEFSGIIFPAAFLHAAYRDGGDRFTGDEKGGIDDPVLFGALQFLAFHQQHRLFFVVSQFEPVHVAGCVNFGYQKSPAFHGLFQGQVIWLNKILSQNWKYRQIAVDLLFAQPAILQERND